MAEFKVVEKFVSINGEGVKAGQLAVFIRFSGCNLNCEYCDTKWANEADTQYEVMNEFEIYKYIKDTGIKNVTLTGGEPLFRENMDVLLRILSVDEGLYIEIETNGSVDFSKYLDNCKNISFTMDYKLSASGMEEHMCIENMQYLRKMDTVKFVVGSIKDLERAKEVIEKYQLTQKCHIYISPVFGKIDPADIVEFMKNNYMNDVNLQLQLHKFIWDPDKKGV